MVHRPTLPERPLVRSAQLRLGDRVLPLLSPARVYVCGITPYDVTHLGHAATFVWSDVAASVLRGAGLDVVTCRNVTDVDDVLTHAADARGRAYDEFALYQEYLFDKDMTALGVHRPDHEPRARHFITQVQQLAAALLATGHAYHRDGRVYFRAGDLVAGTGLSTEEALALSAEYGDDPADPLREDPFDVPIWRPSAGIGRDAKAGGRVTEPAWPSPWGPGRPGWHVECAVMAVAVLGTSVDLVAGGHDLRFPHHAYQAAMVAAATSVTPFARAHLHVGTVYQNGAKMAKSTGNLTLVSDLLRDHPPAAVRLLILDRPWWQPWDYQPERLDAAAGTLEDLYASAGRPDTSPAAADAVSAALMDNLDVPRAVAIARESGGAAARSLLRVLSLV